MAAADAEKVVFGDDAGFVAAVCGHDQPLLPLRFFSKDDWAFPTPETPDLSPQEPDDWARLLRPLPKEVVDYYDSVQLHATTLFHLLQAGAIVGMGYTADGHLVEIAQTIWSHERYYIHPPTGDIYEADGDTMTKRWSAVFLVHPQSRPLARPSPALVGSPSTSTPSSPMFHVKPPASDAVPSTTTEPQQAAAARSKRTNRVETRGSSYRACVAWHVKMMQASPNERAKSKSELWREAQEKWPRTLSERSFLNARDEAIRATGAIAWGTAGAPKKSRRVNRSTD